jgi:hypothetical protein
MVFFVFSGENLDTRSTEGGVPRSVLNVVEEVE